MKTFVAREQDVVKKWYVVDAKDQIIGRLATQIAMVLRGKTKPIFTPHCDTGDFVVVVNADQALFTGKKLDDKIYYRHSGYMGGIKSNTARQTFQGKPEAVLRAGGAGYVAQEQFGETVAEKVKDLYRRRTSPSGSKT